MPSDSEKSSKRRSIRNADGAQRFGKVGVCKRFGNGVVERFGNGAVKQTGKGVPFGSARQQGTGLSLIEYFFQSISVITPKGSVISKSSGRRVMATTNNGNDGRFSSRREQNEKQ